MKQFALALLAVSAISFGDISTARAGMPTTIGAGSVGYGATVKDQGDLFTHWWAGLNVLPVSEHTAIYGCYQRVGKNGGNGGDGAKLVLISGSQDGLKGLYLIADLGIAFNLAEDADGSEVAAFTTGGGAALALTEYISPFIYASAYDAGERFTWAVHCGLAVTDIQKLAGLKF